MKQKIYTLGVITAITVFAGTIFKINHFPGAAILLIAGISSLVLLFLPLALSNHYRSGESRQNLSLYIVTYITGLVIFVSMLFKLLHWPYAGVLLTIALPFPYVVFLPVFLFVTSKDRNFSIYNTAFVLMLLALNSVFAGLLALNVTSDKVVDSYQLAKNYINQEESLSHLSLCNSGSAVNRKADEAIKTVNEVREIILKWDDKTGEQWKNAPGNLTRPDFKGSVTTSLTDSEREYIKKLQKELKDLVFLMQATPGYRIQADNILAVVNYKSPQAESSDWYQLVFNDFYAWVLIYLDALESNLYMIKAYSPSGSG
jgi:hypothetical protein